MSASRSPRAHDSEQRPVGLTTDTDECAFGASQPEQNSSNDEETPTRQSSMPGTNPRITKGNDDEPGPLTADDTDRDPTGPRPLPDADPGEDDMQHDENQPELFDVPAPVLAEAAPPKKKRKPPHWWSTEGKAQAEALLKPFWDKYASAEQGGWPQGYFPALNAVMAAMKNGMSAEDVTRALDILGPQKMTISAGTMQIALTRGAQRRGARAEENAEILAASEAAYDPTSYRNMSW